MRMQSTMLHVIDAGQHVFNCLPPNDLMET